MQVEAGRFISGTDQLQIAVLHSRKLCVYTLTGTSGAVEHGSQYHLRLAYEHNLKRSAFNFCCGPFGGVKGKDFICIQSIDGTLNILEQESFAFSRFLPGALLPGPLCYVGKMDSFVTISSSWQVESYKYQVLAVATDAKTKEESQNPKSGKRVTHDWTFNLGEPALDLSYVQATESSPSALFVLGERSLFCLSEMGKLLYIKKFDFNPSCFLPYPAGGGINCIVGTHTGTLLVYRDVTLKWAAQVDSVPVQIKRATITDLKGVIVSLDESGHLGCSYLGTDPSMFTPAQADDRDVDYGKIDSELKQLQGVIRQQQSNVQLPTPQIKAEDELQINVEVSPHLDNPPEAENTEIRDAEPVPSLAIKVMLKVKMSVSDASMSVHLPPPLTASENVMTYSSIESSMPVEKRLTVYMKNAFIPPDMTVHVSVTFVNSNGAPRVVHTKHKLPLKLVARPCLPIKNAEHKLTLDTNKPSISLNELFPDLLGDNADGPGNALGFQLIGGPVVTILASKTSQRYRLQCDDFPAIWPVLNDMISRLTSHFNSRRQTDFAVSFDGPLPLQEYFDILDGHFEFREKNEKFKEILAERASQFRAIQRRLLTRFKDKTPSPLANLDTLLDGTYKQIIAVADAAVDNNKEQLCAACSLSSGTRLLNLLVKLWAKMDNEEFGVLEGALNPEVSDQGDQGWEEQVDAAVTHLLRTCLAKSSKDTTINPQPLTVLSDTTKLKKHIALVCDRLSKGARLTVDPSGDSKMRQPIPISTTTNSVSDTPGPSTSRIEEVAEPDDLDQGGIPIGSQFGENKSPRPNKTARENLPSLSDAKKGTSNGSALPPLGGSMKPPSPPPPYPGSDEDDNSSVGSKGSHFLKKKKSISEDTINDSNKDNGDALLNGGNELVFGL